MINPTGAAAAQGTQSNTPPAAAVTDGAMKVGVTVVPGPPGIAAAFPCEPGVGRALPVKHQGSVDVMLEALNRAQVGDVMVIDDQGRRDRACIGDLIVAEAKAAGVQAIVVWGSHRDSVQLRGLALPIFSLGSTPLGPDANEPHGEVDDRVFLGDVTVPEGHWVVFDPDGVALLENGPIEQVIGAAKAVASTEQRQREVMETGVSLRQQLSFDQYLAQKKNNADFSFREHLRKLGGAIEV